MAIWKSVGISMLALTLVSWSGKSWAGDGVPVRTPESSGEVSTFGSLGCGALACVDVYKVRCSGATRFIAGSVTDNDIDEDNLTLTLTGLVPGPIKGNTAQTFIPFGAGAFATSSFAFLVRHAATVGAMQAYAAVSNISPIVVAYIVGLQCFDAGFGGTPTFITVEQNQ